MSKLTIPPVRVHPVISPTDDFVQHVQNHSTRHGVHPDLIVLHDTESGNLKGVADLAGIGSWFNNPASQASAHVAVDGEGNSARYVMDSEKAWSCVFYNARSLNLEQIGFNGDHFPEAQLQEVARWIALWSDKHDIPIRHGRVQTNGVVATTGVVRHSELGVLGGAHHDLSVNYPLHEVLDLARFYRKMR